MRQPGQSTLALDELEIVALKATIDSGLEELAHTQEAAGDEQRRLLALQQAVQDLSGQQHARLPLEREDAQLLRTYVTMVIAMHGYIVGRPEAINALVSLRGKLDRIETTR